MGLSRRGFLGLIPALAAGLVLDPDRLLWVPGRATWFDLGAGGHPFVDLDWFVVEVQQMATRSLTFAASVDREYQAGWSVGNVLRAGDLVTIEGIWR